MPKKAISTLTDQQLARRVFSPGMRKQLKEVLAALDDPKHAGTAKKTGQKVKKRYFKELHARRESLEPLVERVGAGRVTFVFAARELRFNNAVALKEYMECTI